MNRLAVSGNACKAASEYFGGGRQLLESACIAFKVWPSMSAVLTVALGRVT